MKMSSWWTVPVDLWMMGMEEKSTLYSLSGCFRVTGLVLVQTCLHFHAVNAYLPFVNSVSFSFCQYRLIFYSDWSHFCTEMPSFSSHKGKSGCFLSFLLISDTCILELLSLFVSFTDMSSLPSDNVEPAVLFSQHRFFPPQYDLIFWSTGLGFCRLVLILIFKANQLFFVCLSSFSICCVEWCIWIFNLLFLPRMSSVFFKSLYNRLNAVKFSASLFSCLLSSAFEKYKEYSCH